MYVNSLRTKTTYKGFLNILIYAKCNNTRFNYRNIDNLDCDITFFSFQGNNLN